MSSMFSYIEFESMHVVEVAELGVAAGQEDVGRVQRLHHVQRREAAGLHLLPVEVGHDRADLAAVDHRSHRPGLAHDHVADLVAAHVVEHRLVVGRIVAVDRHDAHRRHRRRIEGQDHRRQRARRQVGHGRQGQRVDLRQAPLGSTSPWK